MEEREIRKGSHCVMREERKENQSLYINYISIITGYGYDKKG